MKIDFLNPILSEEEKAVVRDQDVAWVQKWLNENCGTNLEVDGVWGTVSRATFLAAMTCRTAEAITEAELLQIATELGDTNTSRIKAVAAVESNGSGWFNSGLPKILYERHKFWKHSGNRDITWYSNPTAGGYTMDANSNGINDSWEKLSFAIGKNPLAALKSISIGKYQVMGEYYLQCGYQHPIEMLYACSRSELAQYQLLRDYILNVANLKGAFLQLGTNASSNEAFAKGYNGIAYRKNDYHIKLASAMKGS